MARSFEPDQSGFDAILRLPAVEKLVDDAAERVLTAAKASAPVDSEEYRDSIHLEHEEAKYRRVVRVVADARHAMKVESRTGNLARALKSAKQ